MGAARVLALLAVALAQWEAKEEVPDQDPQVADQARWVEAVEVPGLVLQVVVAPEVRAVPVLPTLAQVVPLWTLSGVEKEVQAAVDQVQWEEREAVQDPDPQVADQVRWEAKVEV